MRDAARLARTARPSAPPIMNAVLATPEARPVSLCSTSLIAASSTGLNAIPIPNPTTIIGGSTSTRKLPPTGARANSRRPRAIRLIPTAIGRLTPKRITIFADSPSENAPMIRFEGRNASPTWSGLYPSTSCR